MSEWRGIEELHLSPRRPVRTVPRVPLKLLDTIRRHGPIAPVIVRKVGDRNYEILDNAETWLAAQRLGQHQVPVEVLADLDDEDAAAIVEAASTGYGQDPITEAEELAARLTEVGGRSRWGATRRLAAITGLSRSYVSHAVRLLRLSEEVQSLLRSRELAVGHAKLLVGLPDARTQLAVARRIVAERLSVRSAETLIREMRGDTGTARGAAEPEVSERDPDVLRLERILSETLGCRTRLSLAEGALIVEYGGDLDLLDGLLQRLGIRDF